jgi:sugar lactone lactonase YvrE
MTRAFHTLLADGAFFESPRWHDGRWWVSDFYRHLVLAIDSDGNTEEIMTVEGQPSGIGWMPDGTMRVTSMKDHKLLERSPSGEITEVADLTAHSTGHTNDMVIDGQGRAFIGNFGFDLMGGGNPAGATLVRVDPDGTVTPVAHDLMFPNGSVITPDGMTLIVGESMGSRYTAFTIDEEGSLSDRRIWGQIAEPPTIGGFEETLGNLKVAPDGCALDADGHIWAADAMGARAIRVAPGGEIVDEIRVPSGLGIFACMLGGDDGTTLLLCTAPDFFEHNRTPAREAVLVTTTVDVPHAGLP